MQPQQQMRTNTLPKLNKNIRTMPKWVNEAQDRIGPKPPAPPPSPGNSSVGAKPPALPPKSTNQPEPDYEVIEFSGQQYSNEPMIKNNSGLRPKTPDAKLKCTLCGSNNPWVTCDECAQQIFCASCDDMFHKHPKRKSHMRKAIEQNLPPIPPKVAAGQPGPTPPVAPPRRSKRGFPTPLLQRKNQVINNCSALPPPSPTPSMKSSTWHDRVDTLKRGMSFSNRPLPETPRTPTDEMSSRSTTPKSVFDSIQRPPSVTLEKIKSKASAHLDRMAILQQRYRQQKEEQEHSRSNSVTDQNFPFDQWSNISPSPSHFRSGSMSSGLNSSHLDLSDDIHLNLSSRQRQPQQQQFTMNRNGNLSARNMSTSVFNLSQTNRKPLESNSSWMNSQVQQAQSMAHLNCANCNVPNRAWPPSPHQHQQQPVRHPDDWNNQFSANQQLNRSNLSLNMPAMYLMPQHHPGGVYPPPVFMNQHGMGQNMYPYPYPGMPIMNTGVIAMPPTSRSRATSRANSRLPSPTLSRKSLSLRKKHSGYTETDPTDDEDSDQDDRRSLISNRSGMTGTSRTRQRRISSASQGFLDDENETTNPRNLRSKIRDQRRGSTAKSVQNDWTSGRHNNSSNNVHPNESNFGVPSKPSKIYSDLDSESSGTRALVQAKIQQKLEEGPKNTLKSKKVVETPPNKKTAEVQVDTARNRNQVEISGSSPASEKLGGDQVQANLSDGENQYESEEVEEVDDPLHENDSKEENVVTESTIKSDEEDGSPLLGPPPSTPDHEWECEFCTFVNEPKVKICSICCKTPNKPPTAPKKLPPQVQVKSLEAPKSTTPTSVTHKTKTKQQAMMNNTETKNITNGTAVTSKLSQSEDDSEATTSKMKVQKNAKKSVESVEDIWAALDENIQATAGEVIRNAKSKNSQKVSTSCGPSPPREMKQSASVKKVSKEIGTSPPPQTISTQTYDTLPLLKIDTKEQVIMPVENKRALQNEYATETHSTTSPDSNLAFYRDVERDRYRSSNDLHQSEASPIDFSPLPPLSSLGRRQSSVAELLGMQRAQSQLHTQYNLQGFHGEQPYFEYKPARDPETELYLLIKEAELYKFTSDELHVALKHCGSDIQPVQWLRENWSKLIQTVQSLATKYGQERAENTIGTISQTEAREALCIHFGNIWQAVSECIEQRQRKYREISNKGNFSREDIVTALTAHHGNTESALIDLSKTQLKPFLMRIWGSPGGIENESGINLPQSPSTQSLLDGGSIRSDIHEFLNANALESAQSPPLAASLKDNSFQTHYPLNNHHYRLADNISNYIHDSKETTVSPFQLEESPLHNKSMLKDLETLIGNMEQNQAKQNEEVLRNIEGMFSNLLTRKDADLSDFDEERIFMKSPINAPKTKLSEQNAAIDKPLDVKNFVWQHIQEIVPDLVQQVEKELMERDEKDQEENQTTSSQLMQEIYPIVNDDVIMESLIKPNIKYSSIREELPPHFIYASEITNFRMEFDRARDLEQETDFDALSLEEAPRKFFKMFIAQKNSFSDINANESQKLNLSSNNNNIFVSKTEHETISSDRAVFDNSDKFPNLFNVATAEALHSSSQTNFQVDDRQSQLDETELLKIPTEPAAHASLTEHENSEGSTQGHPLIRNFEKTEAASHSTNENVNVEYRSQLPVKNCNIEKLEIGAQALFTEQKDSESSNHDHASVRNSETTPAFSSGTNKIATKDNVEHPNQLPLESSTIENSENELRMPVVASSEIKEIQTATGSERYETNLDEGNSISMLRSSEDNSHSKIAEEKPSTSKGAVKRKPIDKKSQLPRHKKIITEDRSRAAEGNIYKTKSISSEVSNEFKDTKGPEFQPHVMTVDDGSKTTNVNSSKNTTIPSNLNSNDWEETETSPPIHAEVIYRNHMSRDNEKTDIFENSESMVSTQLNDALSIETTAKAASEESIDLNTTNTKVLKSSKIPVRRSTSISNAKNQKAESVEKLSINFNENQINANDPKTKHLDIKEYVILEEQAEDSNAGDQIKVSTEEPIVVELNVPIGTNQNPLSVDNALAANSIKNVVNGIVLKPSIAIEKHPDNESDVFQDVAEHSSGDEAEENNIINTNETKSIVVYEDEEYEETSDEELFSLHSNYTAPEEETSTKFDENLLEHDQQEYNGAHGKNLVANRNDNTAMKEFVPSSDPSKQNLSELVMDTKRLIKQMKDEINMELESSEDELDDYSDEYEEDSAENDDWNGEEGEEEEEESDFNEEDEDVYLEEIADEVDDDYTETRYDYENGEDAQVNNLNNSKTIDNKQSSDISKRSTSKDNTGDGSSTDSEIEDLEHDELREESNRLPNQNQKEAAALNSTELNYTQSLSFGVSSSITNTPSQTASSEIESSTHVDIPFIAVSSELLKANSVVQNLNSAIQNEEHIQTQIHEIYQPSNLLLHTAPSTSTYLQDSLNNQTVEKISLSLPEVIQENEPIKVNSNEQEESVTQQELIYTPEASNTDSNKTVVPTELEFQIPITVINQNDLQNSPQGSNTTLFSNETFEKAVENNEPITVISQNDLQNSPQGINTTLFSNESFENAVENNEPNSDTATSEIHANTHTISKSNGFTTDEGSLSPTDSIILTSQTSTYQTNQDFNATTVIQQKMPKQNSSISKIPKPKESKKSNMKSKALLRSKSFSGPPTPIGISSVKAIQQEFLNRQTQLASASTQLTLPTTVFRKKSITETISKLTKPFDLLDGPSTSAAAKSIFRPRTQPRIPKKKYHETCFSDDDYQTSSSETEPEPIIVRERKQSVPVFRTYPSIQEPEVVSPEILARNLIEEHLLDNFAEAQIAAALINMKFQKDVSVWAAKECSDLDQAIGLLQQECELCMGTFAMNQMTSMLKCTHKCCKECAKSYFTVQITDRSINDCNCPFCKLPELHGQNQHEDENLEYFSNLDIFLKSILDAEVHELFQRKLRDRTLLQDPNFKWCVQCSSGFFARPKQKRLICPDCGSVTCSQCRKIWEKQHEGISCEKYLEWKEANDPEIQAQGVQQHLAQHGIDCPKCKFRYSLARGGCMHFTCTQCKFEFCYGCAKPFMMGAKCNISPYCSKLGLHAHHPRNCLFYLRDKLPLQLQFLLKGNGVAYDVDPMISHDEAAKHTPGRCPVALQKEAPKGLVDTVCNGEVSDSHAGLCRTHYVEYLSAKVAKARIDPLPIFDLTDCVQELRRRGIPLPERGPWDTDEIYKGMCSEIIKQKIPLETD